MIRRTRDTGLNGAPAAPAAGARPQRPTRPGAEAAPRPVRPATGERAERPVRPQRGETAGARLARDSSAGRPERAAPAGRAAPTAGAAPASTGELAGDTLILMRELTTLLEWENAEIKAHRYQSLTETVERKQALTRAYQEKFIAFYRDPKLAEAIAPERRAALKAESERLTQAMETNGTLLRAGMDAVKRVMGNVVSAMEQLKAEAAPHYEGSGRLEGGAGDPRRMSLTLNKEL